MAGVASALACPRCEGSLMERSRGLLRLDVCPSGHGAYATADALRRAVPADVLARLDAARGRAARRATPCPGCRARLLAVDVPAGGETVEVDACAACGGHWFDAGELERLAQRHKDGPAPPDPWDGPKKGKVRTFLDDVGTLTLLDLVVSMLA